MVGPLKMVVGVMVGGGRRVSQAEKKIQDTSSKKNPHPDPPP